MKRLLEKISAIFTLCFRTVYIWVTVCTYFKTDDFITVKSHKRYQVSHEGMLTSIDPCESTGSMHLAIRELECECKFLYNFNCRPDCPNRTPTNTPGKRKSKKEKEAYDKARIEFRNEAETKLGLRIGMLTTVWIIKDFLSI